MAVNGVNVSPGLALVLNRAGDKSGVDFDYLLQTAIRESSLNPSAKASTSSAVGLFQFLKGTWLDVMKSDGPRLGYQKYASAIETDAKGNLSIPNKRLEAEVLKLRENPEVAADLAAAFTRRNGEYLSNRFGRTPSPGELYIAHFLGAEGASNLFEAGLKNPDQIAANLFPRQAAANRAIFYSGGKARTIREVYGALVAKHGASTSPPAAAAGFATQQLSQSQPERSGVRKPPLNMSFRHLFSPTDTQGTGKLVETPEAGRPLFKDFYSK